MTGQHRGDRKRRRKDKGEHPASQAARLLIELFNLYSDDRLDLREKQALAVTWRALQRIATEDGERDG